MNYEALISTIAATHQQAQAGAAGAVNRHLILRNWLIGAHLIEFEQHGQDRAQYGTGLLKSVACHDNRGGFWRDKMWGLGVFGRVASGGFSGWGRGFRFVSGG